MPEKEVFNERIDELITKLNSHGKSGLTSSEARARLQRFGQNITAEERKVSVFEIFFRQFKNFIVYVLIFAAVISYLIGNVTECIVITAIIVFIIMLSFLEERKATREMEALKKLTPKKARVLREGKESEIIASELVPGDILVLQRGDIVAADAVLIEANLLKVDESTLTGESVTVDKVETQTGMAPNQQNIVLASSQVTSGDARCLVIRTGKETEIGKVSEMVRRLKVEETPLQKRLNKLGKQFSIGVLVICVLILLIGLARGQHINELLLLAVAVAVSGVPESLPAVTAVALAIGMKRMAKQNVIIKRLPAVETLGTCTVICTDKTGTLTQNKMVIDKIYTFDAEVNVTGEGFTPKGLFMREDEAIDPKLHKGLLKILEIGVLCNNSSLLLSGENWKIDGEPTEGALIVVAKKAGIDKADYHAKFPRIHEHPFDDERKCMSTIHIVKNKPIVYVKGAPELLVKKSSFYLEAGKVKPMSKKIMSDILEKTKEYASGGLRVIGLAYKEHSGTTLVKHVESNLIFVGLASMRDPPQPSAYESVKQCKEAGIRVVMITGDNEVTALAVAKELGIFEHGNEFLTGAELDKMSDAEFQKIADEVTVYARTTPRHKLRIVEALQARGDIVAMTGDGVNDAPALKKADIGIAMGKCGTEVAKEASEMIIKDDNFSTIVTAIREGRTIYANIRKFIYFLLAGNFSEVTLILIAALLGVVPPLTPLMILFINLVTSDFPALGLCLEKPSKDIMKQKPRDPKEGILSDYLLLKIGVVVPWIILGTIALFMWELVLRQGTIPKAQTMAFATLIMFELFHIFNAKSFDESVFSKKTFTNIALFFSFAFSALCTLVVIYWEPARYVFGTVALSASDWLAIIIMASMVVVWVEVQKSIINSEIRERQRMQIYATRR